MDLFRKFMQDSKNKSAMRLRFEPPLSICQTSICVIKLSTHYYKSCDEQHAAVFTVLQIFKTPALNDAVFSILIT